jgi:hypothetical protein
VCTPTRSSTVAITSPAHCANFKILQSEPPFDAQLDTLTLKRTNRLQRAIGLREEAQALRVIGAAQATRMQQTTHLSCRCTCCLETGATSCSLLWPRQRRSDSQSCHPKPCSLRHDKSWTRQLRQVIASTRLLRANYPNTLQADARNLEVSKRSWRAER